MQEIRSSRRQVTARAALASVLGLAAISAGAQGEPAAPPSTGPAYSITYFEALPNHAGKTAAALDALTAALRADPGWLGGAALQRMGRPEDFVVIEIWKDQKSLESAEASESVRSSLTAIGSLLRSPVDERLNVPSVSDIPKMAAALASRDPYFVFSLTHADVIPAVRDKGLATTRGIAAPSRAESGNVAYEVLQQASRMNHVTLMAVWNGRRSFEAHESGPSMLAFRSTFRPLSGSLYDERLYRFAS